MGMYMKAVIQVKDSVSEKWSTIDGIDCSQDYGTFDLLQSNNYHVDSVELFGSDLIGSILDDSSFYNGIYSLTLSDLKEIRSDVFVERVDYYLSKKNFKKHLNGKEMVLKREDEEIIYITNKKIVKEKAAKDMLQEKNEDFSYVMIRDKKELQTILPLFVHIYKEMKNIKKQQEVSSYDIRIVYRFY